METWKKFKEATLTSNDSCWFHDKPSNQKRSYKHFPPKRRTIRMAATTVNHLHFYCFHLVSVYHLPLKTTCRPRYVYLPFTKNQLIAICARFWMHMDLVNRNIFGSSLFWARSEDGVSFRGNSFGRRRQFSDNWSSCTNKYQKSDEIWQVEYNFSSRFVKKENNVKGHSTYLSPEAMPISSKQKLSLSGVFYFQKLPFYSCPTDLVNTKRPIALIVVA